MDNKSNQIDIIQIGIKDSTIGEYSQIEIHQTIVVPRKSDPIPSNVRQGSPNFVGRDQDLADLDRALQMDGIVAVCAVRGMGGVGKTELALQYANSKNSLQRYVACYLFSLNDGDLASLVLQKAAPYLAMPEEIQKSDDIFKQVEWCWQNWHPKMGEILIILDDVKDLADLPKKAMPIDRRFKVMLTTRQKNLSPSFQELQLGVLSEDESLQLLRNIVDAEGTRRIDNEIEIAKEICQFVGYLPLALELAAIYLVEDEMLTLGEYWQQLTIQNRSLSDEMVKWITAERGVIATFALSWGRLVGFSQQLAMLLGRFAPADIPWQELVVPTVQDLGWEESAVRKGRVQLANLHLISIREQKNIGIHSLLREYFRYQINRIGEDFVHNLQRRITNTAIAIAKTMPQTPIKADIEKARSTIPHLELISRQMLDDIDNPEENLFWAFNGVEKFYAWQGIFTTAMEFSQSCLSEVETRLGSKHPVVASCLNNRALIFQAQGKYSDAKSSLLRAMSIKETRLDQNTQISYAVVLNNLALQENALNNYDQAELLCLEALSVLDQQPEVDTLIFATFLNNLGHAYKMQGKYNMAKSIYEESLLIRESKLGNNHPTVAESLNNLGGLYFDLEDLDNAEKFYLRSLSIRENQQTDDHPDLLTNLHNLSQIYLNLERLNDAEFYCLKSLELRRKKLGDNHPYVATTLSILATIYLSQGKQSEAEINYLEALKITEMHLAEMNLDTNLDVAVILSGMAELYKSQNKYKEAEQLYLSSLEIMEKMLGINHFKVVTVLIGLSAIYRHQEKYDVMEKLLKRALTITESSMGTDHPNSKMIRNVILQYQQEIIELNGLQWILSESFTFVLRLSFIQIDDQKRTINLKWWQIVIVILCLPFTLIFNFIRSSINYFCGKYFRI